MDTSPPDDELPALREALDGDDARLGVLLESYRDRLRRMVGLRMDRRLFGRLDPSDVIQEAYIDVYDELSRYVDNPEIPFFLWVRFLTGRKLGRLHRHHLGTKKRDAAREVRLHGWATPEASSIALAEVLAASGPSPSQVATREEEKRRIVEALEALPQIDREVLALRHFEHLTNVEIARLLAISENAANIRYMRAARRLKQVVDPARERGSGERG